MAAFISTKSQKDTGYHYLTQEKVQPASDLTVSGFLLS